MTPVERLRNAKIALKKAESALVATQEDLCAARDRVKIQQSFCNEAQRELDEAQKAFLETL